MTASPANLPQVARGFHFHLKIIRMRDKYYRNSDVLYSRHLPRWQRLSLLCVLLYAHTR